MPVALAIAYRESPESSIAFRTASLSFIARRFAMMSLLRMLVYLSSMIYVVRFSLAARSRSRRAFAGGSHRRHRQLPARDCHSSSVPHSGQGAGGSITSIASSVSPASGLRRRIATVGRPCWPSFGRPGEASPQTGASIAADRPSAGYLGETLAPLGPKVFFLPRPCRVGVNPYRHVMGRVSSFRDRGGLEWNFTVT